MVGLSSALDEVRAKLRDERRQIFEARVQVLKEQYEQALAFEEHSLTEGLAVIDQLFGVAEADQVSVGDAG